MSIKKLIWMDGRLVKWENAKVHILTHSLHYGSSVFEGIHSYKTADGGVAIFRLKEHIQRLFHSANSLSMKINFTKEEIVDAVKRTIKINRMGNAYIRPLAYYGYGNIGVFPDGVPTKVSIITLPWKHYYSKNLRVMTSKYARHSERSTVFGAKIGGNYANSVLAMYEARKKGYDEALMLDYDGLVSEGPAENIFLVKDGSMSTPSSRSALHGITRSSILEISKDMGMKAYEKNITLKELGNADELFFCGTATEIAPIISIDGKGIGNGKIGETTLKLQNKFYDIVRGKDRKYGKWLSYVD